jgi:glycosyltransferase involved in cell wall biosynthesis
VSRSIVHICQPTDGGAAVCVRQLAGAGREAGFDVTVACPPEGPLAGWAQASGARWVPLPMVRSPRPRDVRDLTRVRRLAAGADVLHLHASKAGALGRMARVGLRRRPRVVFTPHGWSWLVGGSLAPAYRMFERATAPLADVIVAVSDDDRAIGLSVLSRSADRVVVIGNGVDVERFSPDGPAAERGPEPLLVCVGRLTEAKGQSLAIDALSRMRTPGARLRLVGDGEDEAMLRDAADRAGVADRVEFTGTVEDTAPYLRAADLVVVPSKWDAQSLVLLEAMACGAAILATRVSGSSAVEGVGVIARRRDPAEFAAQADALLTDPGRRAELGAAARERAVERFAVARSNQRWVELWTDLAGASPNGTVPR